MDNDFITASDKEIFIFDLTLHILILFGVLIIMFFLIVAPTSSRGFNRHLSRGLEKLNSSDITFSGQTMTPLQYLNRLSCLPGETPNNCAFYTLLQGNVAGLRNQQSYYENNKSDMEKDSYNSALTISTIIIFLVLIIFVIFNYYLLKVTARRKFNITKLIVSNILLFLLIGCIEVLFFYNITLDYSPVTETDLSNFILNDFKKLL